MVPARLVAARTLGVVGLLAAVAASAWVADDAYITFRTVVHWLDGCGPVYNCDERVLAVTHPLWLLLLTGLSATGVHPHWAALGLSFALTVATAVLLLWVADARRVLLGAGLLAGCKAFVDFSTSGLEGPLSFLLLAAFTHERLKRARPGVLGAFAGLALLTRHDLVWLVLPGLLGPLRRAPRAVLAGFMPLALWLLGAWVYYGNPLPNTAAAKLGTGISTAELIPHGLSYLANSWTWDPVLLLSLAVAAVASAWPAPGRPDRLVLVTGIVLYLAYVVGIGGDFMSGRFLAPAFVVAVSVLLRAPVPWPALAVLAILGALGPRSPLTTGPGYDHRELDDAAIADERGFYYQATGLWPMLRRGGAPIEPGPAGGNRVEVIFTIGVSGFSDGSGDHILDLLGLADPLLARLPARPGWRIGHYERAVPAGYVRSLEEGRNEIEDPEIAALLDALWWRCRAPVFSADRWRVMLGATPTGPAPWAEEATTP